ncbi:MAG: hypothetical protein ACRDKW_16825 [Actinomycetota bacterium]
MGRNVAAGVVLAVAGCGTNAGENVAAPPSPSPQPASTGVPAPPPQPAEEATFEFRLDPRGTKGNVVLTGGGCTGEGATIELIAYDAEGTEVPVVGGPAGADGNWELPIALRKGRYRVSPKCYAQPRALVVSYQPREINVR